MMSLLALTPAVLYGAADFLGGVASRRVSTTVVVAMSQAAGLVVLLAAIGLLPPADPMAADLAYGAGAGVAGAGGLVLLYRALAIGVMGVVAPITAVCAVAVPVLFSAVRGDRPAPLVVVGILLALLAIVLVSQQPSGAGADRGSVRRLPPGVPHALASGVAIGAFFVVLSQARPEAGLWPLVGARGAAVPICVGAALIGGASFRAVSRRTAATAAAAGIVDMSANVLYLVASQMGSLPVAVTLSSLYPASTVVLARIVLGERLYRVQVAGMLCALVAVACIVVGGAR